ncbi:DUF1168-domain-containing protein, partial [Phlegmacium glaucopus]
TPSTSTTPANRHVLTAVEKQRSQLDKLLKDPTKPAYIPPPPKEKTIRAAREMMKNVQGSSAGAGSGEFHVYKASRRREYERLKLLEEATQKETEEAEFERKRREAEEISNAKTTKNRLKRQKKKEKVKMKGNKQDNDSSRPNAEHTNADLPLKKRRLINGKELVFRRPGDSSDEDLDAHEETTGQPDSILRQSSPALVKDTPAVLETSKITIQED